MYRQTDTVGSPGALTQGRTKSKRNKCSIYVCVCVRESVCVCMCLFLSLYTFYSLFLLARLRGWTGGGGEKQLDGTNDVTNNTVSETPRSAASGD